MTPKTAAACEAAIQALETATRLLSAESADTISTSNPPDLVRFYGDLREQAEALREQMTKLSELERGLSYDHIPTAFDAAGITNIRVTGYGLVSLARRWSCSMLNKEAGFKWLRDHGQEGMIIETVPAPTLGAWARSEIEEKGVEPDPEIFKTSIARYCQLRASR